MHAIAHPAARMILNRAFTLPADGFYHVMPFGEYDGHLLDGTPIVQVLDGQAAENIISAIAAEKAQAGQNWTGVLVDLEHRSLLPDGDTTAAAWLPSVQERNDGLYGALNLTDLGDPLVKGGRYRTLSPVFSMTQIGAAPDGRPKMRPVRLESLGLTNKPNLKGMKPLSELGLSANAEGWFVSNGDLPGHPFMGNQHEDGGGDFSSEYEARQQFDRDITSYLNPKRRAPARLSPQAARTALADGVKEHASDGREIAFPADIEKHWTDERERNLRLGDLNLARETVRTGNHYGLPSGKSYYVQSFRDEKSGMTARAGVVIERDQTVRTWWTQRAEYLKRDDIRNREEARHGRQHPPDSRADYAAAGIGEARARLSTSCNQRTLEDAFLQYVFSRLEPTDGGSAPAAVAGDDPKKKPKADEAGRRGRMNEIAKALGLAEDCDAAAILTAIGKLKDDAAKGASAANRLAELEAAALAAEADTFCATHAAVIANKDEVKKQYVANKAATIALIGSMKQAAPAATTVLNRADGRPPSSADAAARHVAARDAEIEKLVTKNKMTQSQAWAHLAVTHPEMVR